MIFSKKKIISIQMSSSWISDPVVKDWAIGSDFWTIRKKNNASQLEERQILQPFLDMENITSHKQWTNKFGERIVEELLKANGESILPRRKIHSVCIDIETPSAFYEVKTRNWSTSGTAGHKIFEAPYHYSLLAKEKPVYIVLVAYQMFEAETKFRIWNDTNDYMNEFQQLNKKFNIHYVKVSNLFLNWPVGQNKQ